MPLIRQNRTDGNRRALKARSAAAKAANPTAKTIRVGRLRLKGTDPTVDAAIDTALLLTGFQIVQLDAGLAEKWEQAKEDGNTVAAAGASVMDDTKTYARSSSSRSRLFSRR